MGDKEIAKQYGGKICTWSGFDVQQIIPWGTLEKVRQEVRYLIDTYYRVNEHFMMTTGNLIIEHCPLPSLESLLDEVYAYGTKRSLLVETVS